jgi:riboflavin synthase
MFTGLIEEVGRLNGAEPTERGLRLGISAERVLAGLQIGDSVSIDGVCQTVVAIQPELFLVEAMTPTLDRTTLGSLQAGQAVNLERALPLGARMGGHLVQGHVDGVGKVSALRRAGEHVLVDLEVPAGVAEVSVLHGSIAVNGVSLTINALPAADVVQVAIIPHTWASTNFSQLREGDIVNLEGDMIGRYVVEYMKRRGTHAV